MRGSGFGLAEPLFQNNFSSKASRRSKVLTCLSLVIATALAVFLMPARRAVQEPDINMAWQYTQPSRARKPPQPVRAPHVLVQQPIQAARAPLFVQPAAMAVSTAVLDVAETTPTSVGLSEDKLFDLDESVAFWENQQLGSATDNIREAASIMTSIAMQGAEGQQYALAHGVLRLGYFATSGVLGTLAFLMSNGLGGLPQVIDQSMQEAEEGDFIAKGLKDPSTALDLLSRLLLESALSFQQDYRSISSGMYKAPWDMSTPGHRQLTPQYAAQQTLRFIDEAIGTLGRGANSKAPGIWLDSPLYPNYYKNDFHYQTDGWMSERSANVYETSTEVVFLGRQDAMQRLSLLPLRDMAAANNGSPRILEVACGTGRFATFIRDNHPTANMTLLDLSPFYLDAARENDEYWRKTRYPNQNTRPPPATFVQAAAEALPFEDASFDAVVCVYLFHEMPPAARAAAAAEMARVVVPGGMVILTDSMQRGDRFLLTNTAAKAFGKLNEPHVEKYVDTDLPTLFTEKGLTCDRKWLESVTKCLSFRKPTN
eukprot:gnl/TRDRNA2_/TRDRNA2_153836_c0_seq1.p1 gnl/TRDRNA2_/TRDRNA2_153836_c0~~gnl/TRDRNA2_/TRDRNA2_153836_c0_seq1.p1  ORF type:complete len:541 (+),score=102.67 gnl/TRDRNA2_/TRDRNA2_153836_c0_seq1:63-1685(+)